MHRRVVASGWVLAGWWRHVLMSVAVWTRIEISGISLQLLCLPHMLLILPISWLTSRKVWAVVHLLVSCQLLQCLVDVFADFSSHTWARKHSTILRRVHNVCKRGRGASRVMRATLRIANRIALLVTPKIRVRITICHGATSFVRALVDCVAVLACKFIFWRLLNRHALRGLMVNVSRVLHNTLFVLPLHDICRHRFIELVKETFYFRYFLDVTTYFFKINIFELPVFMQSCTVNNIT